MRHPGNMNDQQHFGAGVLGGVWGFFASVKLTVVILLSLAATSVIGTLIPQNQPAQEYLRVFGPFLFQLYAALDLFDMYHSWWFQLFLILLSINIVICSVDRLTATWRIIFPKTPRYRLKRFQSQKNRLKFSIGRTKAALQEPLEKLIAKSFRHREIQPNDKGFVIFAERGRLTRLGVYAVHLSVLLLVTGGLIGSLAGFEGFVNIAEGESTDTIQLRNANETWVLPFAIRCDDFHVEFYPTGAPKEFRSSLTLLEGGKAVLQKDIIVNDPLRYKGINIFQSSYGKLAPESRPPNSSPNAPREFVLTFTGADSGLSYEKKAAMGDILDIPEGLGRFQIKAYLPSAEFSGQPIGEAIQGQLTSPEGQTTSVLLPLRFPNFDKMRKGSVVISAQPVEPLATAKQPAEQDYYYTGLQVTRDPGVTLVYFGFIIMIAGCFVTFFMAHQQICVEAVPRGGKMDIWVSGTANKNRPGFERVLARFAARIQDRLAQP